MHNAFHQGQYRNVIDFDTSPLSRENALPARVLQLRAKIANGQAEEAIEEVQGEESTPDLAAVQALAQYNMEDTSAALKKVDHLTETASENGTVQILAGTILQAEGKSEEALALLAKHQGNLEA